MIFVIGFLMTFMGGFVAAINLTLLLSTNGDYYASWVKVIVSCCIAVFGALVTSKRLK